MRQTAKVGVRHRQPPTGNVGDHGLQLILGCASLDFVLLKHCNMAVCLRRKHIAPFGLSAQVECCQAVAPRF